MNTDPHHGTAQKQDKNDPDPSKWSMVNLFTLRNLGNLFLNKKHTSISEINCQKVSSDMLSHIFLLNVFPTLLEEYSKLNFMIDTMIFGSGQVDTLGIKDETRPWF